MKIETLGIYGKSDSCNGEKLPFLTEPIKYDCDNYDVANRLANTPIGSGHDNFLNGIVVQFDLTASLKFWTQLQRYHFVDFISSTSTMHRIQKMEIRKCCNEYVTEESIRQLEKLQEEYNSNKTEENFLRLIYNIPTGFELMARMTTNYRQLKTIYKQRKNHRLPEWRIFCEWIEGLENSELIIGNVEVKQNETNKN